MSLFLDDPDTSAFGLLKSLGDRGAYLLRDEPKDAFAMAFHPAFPLHQAPIGGDNVTIRIMSDINFEYESWATAYSGTIFKFKGSPEY